MKKMIFMAMMMATVISASAMTYTEARQEALFLSDKMAYELDLTAEQYEAIYEINLDYLMSVNGSRDAYGSWWNLRNRDLQIVLSPAQFNVYISRGYFYRPLTWTGRSWRFGIYSYYDRGRFFRHHPTVFHSYRGGHRGHYDRHRFHPQPRLYGPDHHRDHYGNHGRNNGYNNGHHNGYNNGHHNGHNNGHHNGHNPGNHGHHGNGHGNSHRR